MLYTTVYSVQLYQGFSMGLCQSSVIVVRPVGVLSELSVVLVVTPDLVHHVVRDLLCGDDGLGHVVIVILNEIPLVTQNWDHSDYWG